MPFTEQDQLAVKTIRTLSIDAIEKANSGHPGLPMGAAPMAYVLWSRFMKYNPENPAWIDRDRFVLSAGHGSMLLYSLLHLTGYDVSMDDLKSFRQWGSKTPGHPEFGHTPGVDTTTGPLGQGIATAVGFAMAERFMAATFNREGHDLIDHYTYVICGDGDLMEGVAAEAGSLAGHLGLNKLIVLYDSNDISLDGPTDRSFTEDVKMRYRAYGWNVLRVEDGNNLDEIERAIAEAKTFTDAPTLIEVKTIIGYGAPHKQGTHGVHGSPLGAEETKLAKETYGWKYDSFFVPDEVRALFADLKSRLQADEAAWNEKFNAYEGAFADDAKTFKDVVNGNAGVDFDTVLPEFTDATATRDAFGTVINAIAPHMPTLLGGSADLSSSNKTFIKSSEHFKQPDYAGKNVDYGVREHAMGAALNGLALHGGIFPYAGTFLVFVDYLRPAVRLAALMKQPALYILTHDSIAVGEDGPTHEPVEQIASLRAIPGLRVLRPADGTETGLAVKYALTHRDAPVALVLTRQKLPTLAEIKENQGNFERGGYVIYKHEDGSDLALLASGSEVHLVLEVAKKLAGEGVKTRVISFPSLEVFDAQDEAYKESVLPKNVNKRVAVEMAHPMSWYKYVGLDGEVFGIDRFGASAPGDIVMKEYGFTVDNIYNVAKTVLNK
ncbi:transketolase [Alicyclobacillus fastidiosus]|uniref:Transketolase n=1 Tax=Alicyclobacillus fastidiosus TaxID=392011 RepID=A0ABY6ZFN3_9BACL|nr:transketolase [Alicyclobacillus fastidiosus]WAH40901.1 transketolase [Alicyclobacillus fastidiosus]GMA62395.1 transketolase [Alicyclobacillus fastidiosus]